jgi:LysM repeat protein
MQIMKSAKKIGILSLILLICLLTACQNTQGQQATAPASEGELTPYYTATSSPTVTPTPVNAPTATPQPTLTPTPRSYITNSSDTMWSIAAKNGLTLPELQAANPDVDPYTITAGITLIIPAPSGTSGTPAVPTPTAVAVVIHSLQCTPSLTGGLYCFAVAENQQDFAIQNLVVQFILTDPVSGNKFIQEGLLPLNRLPSGKSLPLFTYFAPPVPAMPNIDIQILSALPVSSGDTKFIDIQIENEQTILSADGYSAEVKGSAKLLNPADSASRFWIAAVVYDAAGNVVGVRKLDDKVQLSGTGTQPFSVFVYSIAGKIDHVEVFGEAIP